MVNTRLAYPDGKHQGGRTFYFSLFITAVYGAAWSADGSVIYGNYVGTFIFKSEYNLRPLVLHVQEILAKSLHQLVSSVFSIVRHLKFGSKTENKSEKLSFTTSLDHRFLDTQYTTGWDFFASQDHAFFGTVRGVDSTPPPPLPLILLKIGR